MPPKRGKKEGWHSPSDLSPSPRPSPRENEERENEERELAGPAPGYASPAPDPSADAAERGGPERETGRASEGHSQAGNTGGSIPTPTEEPAVGRGSRERETQSHTEPRREPQSDREPQAPARVVTAVNVVAEPASASVDDSRNRHKERESETQRGALGLAATTTAPARAESERQRQSEVEDSPLELPSKEQRDQLFDRFDCNGNGALSLAEIDKAVIELWPHFNHKPALMRAYRAADVNGDGFIKRREFRLLLKYVVYFNELWHKFDELDANHDHRLDLQEFKHGCAVLGIRLAHGEAESEFAAMDESNGGFVLFDEFCTWCAYKHVGAQ